MAAQTKMVEEEVTTKDDIRQWFRYGLDRGAAYMIVVCDTFDWDDYPVYVMPGENPRKRDPRGENMQKAMECYDLGLDMDAQLNERRANHWGDNPTKD